MSSLDHLCARSFATVREHITRFRNFVSSSSHPSFRRALRRASAEKTISCGSLRKLGTPLLFASRRIQIGLSRCETVPEPEKPSESWMRTPVLFRKHPKGKLALAEKTAPQLRLLLWFPQAHCLRKPLKLHDEYTPVIRKWNCFFRQAMIMPKDGNSTAENAP